MKNYDADSPLIFIHVPKTAGFSCEKIFSAWFGSGFLRHYYDEANAVMPQKHDVFSMHTRQTPILLYGHFNRLRGFGIQDYYPTINQFITILRDPFELMLSSYFFIRKVSGNWKDQSRIPHESLRDFLLGRKINMLNHFPVEVSMDNYQELIETKFIEIGITEQLGEFLRRIARKLGREFDEASLEHLNATERDQDIPYELRDQFYEKNLLEYSVYQYALSKYAGRKN